MLIRKMTFDDIEFALSLTTREGWSDIQSDFEGLITHAPPGAFIGEEVGKPVGMVSAVSYGKIGFVGSLIVIKECRNRGLGRELMEHAIAYLRDEGTKTLMLDGVWDALSLYNRLGFRNVCRSLRMVGVIEGQYSDLVRPVRNRDLTEVFAMDKRHFGADRSHFLKGIMAQFPKLCKVLEDDGEIKGFVMGSQRGDFVRVAPCVIENSRNGAELLLKSVAVQSKNTHLRLGVLESNIRAVRTLKELGFKEVSSSYRMVLGNPESLFLSDGIYAIGSPAKG